MPKIDKRYDPINRKEKPTLTPSKREELEKLKEKLKSAQEKLKQDPANKKLKEIHVSLFYCDEILIFCSLKLSSIFYYYYICDEIFKIYSMKFFNM